MIFRKIPSGTNAFVPSRAAMRSLVLALIVLGCAGSPSTPASPQSSQAPQAAAEPGTETLEVDGVRLVHRAEPEHTEKISSGHADLVSRLRPDFVFFEYPRDSWGLSRLNAHPPDAKPAEIVGQWRRGTADAARRYPSLAGDLRIIDAVAALWGEGRQVLVFEADGPQELTSTPENKPGMGNAAWLFLRESYMADAVREGVRGARGKTALVICHDFHWKGLKLLLPKPPCAVVWGHYFAGFSATVPSRAEVERALEQGFPTLWRQWQAQGRPSLAAMGCDGSP